MANAGEINPNGVVPIPDYSYDSLRTVTERIERSSRFQHYILRADELDDVCRHVNEALKAAQAQPSDEAEIERLQQLLSGVLEAHELVLEGSPSQAVERLQTLMQ